MWCFRKPENPFIQQCEFGFLIKQGTELSGLHSVIPACANIIITGKCTVDIPDLVEKTFLDTKNAGTIIAEQFYKVLFSCIPAIFSVFRIIIPYIISKYFDFLSAT